jgi:hypothetical protein
MTMVALPSLETVDVLGGEEYGEGPGPVFVTESLFLEGSWNGDLLVRHVEDGTVAWSDREGKRQVRGIAAAADRSTFAWGVTEADRSVVNVRRWPFEGQTGVSIPAGASAIALDTDGRLAEAEGDRIAVWDTSSGRLLARAAISRPHYEYGLAWRPTGGLALTGQDCLWGLDEALNYLWEVELQYAMAVEFSQSGDRIAVGAAQHGVVGRLR